LKAESNQAKERQIKIDELEKDIDLHGAFKVIAQKYRDDTAHDRKLLESLTTLGKEALA
jgi:hypothetical protein